MPPRRLLGRILILTTIGLMGACHPAEHRVRAALDEARYPDALAELCRLEPRIRHHSARSQARYALDRGLAHLAVGDAARAVQWLSAAWEWHDKNPRLLTPTDHTRLVTAWHSMGLMVGDRPLAQSSLATD
jgi:hypothetical protein